MAIISIGFLVDYFLKEPGKMFAISRAKSARQVSNPAAMNLFSPGHKGELSLEEDIFKRRSIRTYKDEPLTLKQISQFLWAAGGKTIDGITGATRAYPSGGGIY